MRAVMGCKGAGLDVSPALEAEDRSRPIASKVMGVCGCNGTGSTNTQMTLEKGPILKWQRILGWHLISEGLELANPCPQSWPMPTAQ